MNRRNCSVLNFLPVFLFAAVASIVVVAPLRAQTTAKKPSNQGVQAVPTAEPRLNGDVRRTRFVIGLEKSVEFQVFSLADPNRVVVELPDVPLQLPQFSGDRPVGLVTSFRGGVSAPGRSRIVIDVAEPVTVEKAVIEKPADQKHARLVLEIVPTAGKAKASTARPPLPANLRSGLGANGVAAPQPVAAARPAGRAQQVFKPVIVIDPGHGGHDSGAKKFGTVEKDVVLAFSLRLRDKLNASGQYRVLMTRDTDTFVELDERRDFADRSKAQLFIAVHADYADSGARGATIYSLRENMAESLQYASRSEVASEVLNGKEVDAVRKAAGDVNQVRGILADLAQRELAVNKERTSVFARSVIAYMGSSTQMMNNPDREANFRVLKSAKMPSVLIELAYVTNRQDAENLRSDAWRNKVTDSIVTAIDNYFSHTAARLPMCVGACGTQKQ